MNSAKGFLLVFTVAYVVLAGAGLAVWGPPGYTAEYMEAHKSDHERYLVITKSTDYKKYMQQGDAAEEDAGMIEKTAFVDAYVASPEFNEESKRLAIYGYYFGFLNAGGLMLIAYRFARAPITSMLDAQIAAIRERLDRAARAKAEASKRLESAQARVGGLKADERQAKDHAADLMARERETLEAGTEHAVSFIDQETEDRKRIAGEQAKKTLRKELVELAARAVAESYVAKRTPETETAQIKAFISGITGRVARESAPK